jgi:hypothetical protein
MDWFPCISSDVVCECIVGCEFYDQFVVVQRYHINFNNKRGPTKYHAVYIQEDEVGESNDQSSS